MWLEFDFDFIKKCRGLVVTLLINHSNPLPSPSVFVMQFSFEWAFLRCPLFCKTVQRLRVSSILLLFYVKLCFFLMELIFEGGED